ncbi:LamG-like jellyroll fold domain-containing protein [Chryseobacterium daeguense]|uniref:LamG-like jellyroll fold domain-containing protein n=1 Tax=Chryseobacterium daeguense TaxID=412438 RepID=UPI000418D0B9|nr:LamG-like jellyroll fold domain-containing protein [Chryseobacterium daeguense]
MKKKLLFLTIFMSVFYYTQNLHSKVKEQEEDEDFEYEMTHKSLPWFSEMKDGGDYFKIRSEFDQYFGNHTWEKSKTRSLGEDWLKKKLFYLDRNGKVVAEPLLLNRSKTKNIQSLNTQTQVGSWTMIGPVNSAETPYSGGGNHGGYVYLNRIDPTNPQRMFVSFINGGLWRTIDGGASWSLVDNGFADSKYNDIDICLANPQVVYALSDYQLLKSTDGGLNWQSTTMTKDNFPGKAYDIAVSPVNADIVVVRWGDSLYRTTDGGSSWNVVYTGLPGYQIWDSSLHSECLEWDPNDSSSVYFASTSNDNVFTVFKSTDQGASFSQLNSTTLDASANGQTIGWTKVFLPTNNANSFYVAVGTGTDAYAHKAVQMYKFNKQTGTLELSRINMVSGIGDPYSHDPVLHHGDIQMDRTNENVIIYGSYGNKRIHFSTDNGASFVLAAANCHSDLRTIDLINNKLILGSDGEAVFSTDLGDTFTTLTNSISNHELWGFGSAFKTGLVASGNNHGPVMIKETYNGFDWYNGTGADQGNTDVNPLDDRYLYSNGYSNYRYFRTGPQALIEEQNYLDNGGIYSYFNQMEFHPNKYYTLITHHAGQYPHGNPNLSTWKNSLIKTEDNGASISIVKTFANQVFREKISVKNPDVMCVVEGLSDNKLWKTTDGGVSWANITPSTVATSGQTNISDIAIGDENPNEIWVTYSGVQSVCKVLKSNDGGATWTNITSNMLTSSPITKIIFQRGSNGGVYVGNKAGVFYRNNSMNNWVMLGNGLPMCDIRFMHINYNENKLKIGTSRGAFEHELYEISPPNAQISVDKNKFMCTFEKLHFKDYSVVRNASATWQWSFPGGTPSSSNLENPEVSYENAANGFYPVTLTVTDQYGTSTQTLANFIEVNNQCGSSQPDKVPGKSISITGENTFIKMKDLNIHKNSFTFSCWVKLGNNTNSNDPIKTLFDIPGTDLRLALLKNGNSYFIFPTTGGLISTVFGGEWIHIALVSSNANVKMYLNGKETTFSPSSSEIFNSLLVSKNLISEIDEVAVWDRPLSIDEVRKWRHLTKSIAGDPILNGLVYYLQFNEIGGSIVTNKNNSNTYATIEGPNWTRQESNAPVFEGVSEKINVNSPGLKDFTTAGVSMEFSPGTYPDGDVWVSRGTINPDTLPDNNINFGFYTIVNNYGLNKNFTPLTSLSFYKNADFSNYLTASTYKLFKRESNGFGNTWGNSIDNADNVSGSGLNTKVMFSNGLNVDSFSQFVLSQNSSLSVADNDKIKDEHRIIVPNPVPQGTPLSMKVPQKWIHSNVIIYDMSGKIVAEKSNLSSEEKILLNIPKGVYTAFFISQTNKYQEKFIIK